MNALDSKQPDLIRLRDGDPDELSQLYRRLAAVVRHRVAGYVRSPDEIDDILQETFLKILKHLDTFDPAKGNLAAYCMTVAKNVAFEHMRRASRMERTADLYERELDREPQQERDMALSEMMKAIDQLPESERAVIRLLSEGMALKDIAEALGVTRVAVYSRLSRARRSVTAKLGLSGHHKSSETKNDER